MRALLRIVIFRIVLILFLFPSVGAAQGLDVDGLQTLQPDVAATVIRASNGPQLVEVIRSREYVVCVSDKLLARRLQQAKISTHLVEKQQVLILLLSGKCDLYAHGKLAKRLTDALRPKDDVSQTDDVGLSDRDGPLIRVPAKVFTAKKSRVEIIADISDPSGVERAELIGPDGQRTMALKQGITFSATYPLARNYKPASVTLRAWDRVGNPSKDTVVEIRRVPFCGSPKGVDLKVVKTVQRDLQDLQSYDGKIDGLAGKITCDAIKVEGFEEPFDWYRLARELDLHTALRLIDLSVDAPLIVHQENATFAVRVIDPRNTRAVQWVRMLVDGKLHKNAPHNGDVLAFDLSIAEGSKHRITFLAMSEKRKTPFAEKTIVVSRSEPLKLELSGEDLIGDRLASDQPQVTISADILGARTGRIFYTSESLASRTAVSYIGSPVRIPLTMPEAGSRAVVKIWAESDSRASKPRQLVLERTIVTPVPDPIPDPIPDPEPDPDPEPEPDLEPSQVGGGGSLPTWLVPVGVALVLITGMFAGAVSIYRKGFRRDRTKPPKVPPTLRVVVEPDHNPTREVLGADLPALVLTVDPGTPEQPVVEFDDESEATGP